MKTIKVNDYYNHPEYYKYMPAEIFELLEEAFLDGRQEVDVSEEMFSKMVEDFKNKNI